jgi:hypothetical protein
MTQPARVSSIDALREFRRALERFATELGGALSEVDATAQRMMSWLSHDQLPYWQHQIRARSEKLAQARSNLLRKQLSSMQDDPTCIDERRAVERAKQAIEDANAKVRLVKKWLMMVDKEYTLYRGATSGLSDTHQRDIPAASIRLAAMVKRLEEYAAIGSQPPTPGGGASSESEGEDGEDMASIVAATEALADTEHSDDTEADVDAFAKLRRLCPSESARAAAPRDDGLVRAWAVAGGTPPQGASRRVHAPSVVDDEEGQEHSEPDRDHGGTGSLTTYLGESPRDDERVSLSPGALDGRDLFLARLAPAFSGDTGWFVGGVEWVAHADPGVGIVSVSVGWLRARRPALSELLRLPQGFLVTIMSGAVGAVLDESDTRVAGEVDGGGASRSGGTLQ